ncbi:hypothetical protein C8Q76DRAFT_442330 [Earliella scabrosa]|nr:hypothetical protein C8Q76DRAFT_442330 [Earliella scabrosa]
MCAHFVVALLGHIGVRTTSLFDIGLRITQVGMINSVYRHDRGTSSRRAARYISTMSSDFADQTAPDEHRWTYKNACARAVCGRGNRGFAACPAPCAGGASCPPSSSMSALMAPRTAAFP